MVGKAGWRLHHCASVRSSNDVARDLPAWSALLAGEQTGGRGRFGRVFVSDPGGLWISAVLPAEGGPERWAGFSLMVGVHLVKLLEDLQIPGVRLRWPNDLMSGQKKLGGLLIEQSSPDSLVVGFGLNVHNAPWEYDSALAATSTSLAIVVGDDVPSIDAIAIRVLDALEDAHLEMLSGGMKAAIDELNRRWADPVAVDILLSGGEHVFGRFAGLDSLGNLRLRSESNREIFVEHQSVEKLFEIEFPAFTSATNTNNTNPNGTQ